MNKALHRRLQNSLSQRGDTIVEVLIAIAIISLVLTGAYSTTHKNLVATRSSQEHSEAVKLLQGQIEAGRASGKLTPGSHSIPTAPFCINTATQAIVTYTAASSICNPSSASGGYKYAITISPPSSGVYNLSATWPKLGGGTDTVNLWYKF